MANSEARVVRLMRTVELSNHPADMLSAAERQRLSAEKHVLSVYEDALIRYRARVQTIRVKRDRVGTSADYLLTLVNSPSGQEPLTDKRRTGISRLIQHDHAHHDKQRHDKRRSGPRPPHPRPPR
jgi:hypothetical protein